MHAPYHVVGVPGSFYGRLFPCRRTPCCLSLLRQSHLALSGYPLQWLLVLYTLLVPQGLETEQEQGASLNKRNIYLAETSPPQVIETYQHF
ncbi:hypothetical protein B296_00004389 [Ensete ventricosum]|uniref:Uncharacterized protein n=1 Tax=Ensete ventricosum TaxID=4639 RepID=A0A427ATV2_ENSVE|nr:hypothetical protein B296_00004389 [Ensete ventricosum]